MYALLTVVDFTLGKSEEEARKVLKSQLIPALKQAPGFVKGLWFGDDNQGHGLVVFETKEQAEQASQAVVPGSESMGAHVLRSEVYPVHAEA
jgi:hypothetical protein